MSRLAALVSRNERALVVRLGIFSPNFLPSFFEKTSPSFLDCSFQLGAFYSCGSWIKLDLSPPPVGGRTKKKSSYSDAEEAPTHSRPQQQVFRARGKKK